MPEDGLKIEPNTKDAKNHMSFAAELGGTAQYSDAEYLLPIYSSRVSAGFPSPGDDHMEGKLDLNRHLIRNPPATFFVKAVGDSMINAGIHSGDILVVDRSLTPVSGKIVIAAIDGLLTVKRLHKEKGTLLLVADNPDYPSIEIQEGNEMIIWGVVTSVIHEV